MEKTFEIKPFVIEGNSGYISATVKVKGYWSHDPITAYLRRSWDQNKQDNAWELTMSHSSGGREPKEVESDTEASINFGNAMIALSEYAREFLSANLDKLEDEYQLTIAGLRAHQQAERERLIAEREEKLAKDPQIDSSVAMKLLEDLDDEDSYICMYARTNKVWARVNMYKSSGRTTYTLNHKRISKRDLTTLLLTSSHRSHLGYYDERGLPAEKDSV